jgi:hypothetical protein
MLRKLTQGKEIADYCNARKAGRSWHPSGRELGRGSPRQCINGLERRRAISAMRTRREPRDVSVRQALRRSRRLGLQPLTANCSV